MRGKQNELLLNMLLLFPTQHLHNSAISAIKNKKRIRLHTQTEPLLPLLLLLPAINQQQQLQQPTNQTNYNQPTTTTTSTTTNLQSTVQPTTQQQQKQQQPSPPTTTTTPKPNQTTSESENAKQKQNKKNKKKQQQPTNVFPGLSRILARRLQTGRVGVPVRASAGECREARRWFDNGLHGRRKGQMRT